MTGGADAAHSTDLLLVIYYLGFGFVAVLAWAGIADRLNEPLDDDQRARWRRVSAVLSVVGLIHPALPFMAADIAQQSAVDQRPPRRLVALARAGIVGSLLIAAVVIASAMS